MMLPDDAYTRQGVNSAENTANPPVAVALAQLHEQIEQCELALSKTDESLSVLYRQLDRALSPDEPEPPVPGQAVEDDAKLDLVRAQSPLVEQIRAETGYLRRLETQVRAMTARAEAVRLRLEV